LTHEEDCTIRLFSYQAKVNSFLFLRLGRRWPVTLGAGIGIGMAYTACENRFRSPYLNRVSLLPVRSAAVRKKIVFFVG